MAAATVLGGARDRDRRGGRAGGRGGPGSAGLGRVPRGGGGGRPGQRRRRRAQARGHPHAGRGLPDRRPGRRLRRGHLGQPQPGRRQRDQVLRPRRGQAARRHRGRDRGPARAASAATAARPADRREFGRIRDAAAEHGATSTTCWPRCPVPRSRRWPACGWWPTARTAPPTARAAGAAPGGRGGHHDRHRARRPEHQRRLRLDRPGPAARGGGRARRGRGHRL